MFPDHRLFTDWTREQNLSASFFLYVLFLANNVQTYALLGLFTFGVIALTRVPFSFLLKGLKPIIWIVAFTFLLHIFMTHEGSVIFSLAGLKCMRAALYRDFYLPPFRLPYLYDDVADADNNAD